MGLEPTLDISGRFGFTVHGPGRGNPDRLGGVIPLVTIVILSQPEQLDRIHLVHICKKCNREIETPKAWLWRKYCPTGHRLLDDAVVRSFWGSFARTFGGTFFLTFAAVLGVAFNPDFVGTAAQRRRFEEGVGELFGFVLILILLSPSSSRLL